MSDAPERIWAIEAGTTSPYRVSCSILEHEPDEGTEYVRADIAERENTELRAELAKQIEVRDNSIDDLQQKWWFQSARAEDLSRQLAEARAEVARKDAALREIESSTVHDAPSDYNRGWNDSRYRLQAIARAALSGPGEAMADKFCRCAGSISADPCIVCGKPKLVTKEWVERKAALEGDADPTIGSGDGGWRLVPVAEIETLIEICTANNAANARNVGDYYGWWDRLQKRLRAMLAAAPAPAGGGNV